MTGNSELAAAVERRRIYKQSPDLETWRNGDHRFGFSVVCRDAETLADAYVAHLAEQQRGREEGEKPIDEAWLRSVGFAVREGDNNILSVEVIPTIVRLEWWPLDKEVWLHDLSDGSLIPLKKCTTRGQLTALLEALKGGA